MSNSITLFAIVVGISIFCIKYVVAFGSLSKFERRVLLLRVLLNVVAVGVLLLPIDYCSAWAYPTEEAVAASFFVAVAEVYGAACHLRCDVGASASALLFALIHADHGSNCGATFFALSVTGLAAAPLLFFVAPRHVRLFLRRHPRQDF